jgi:hypothetical protein
MISVPLTVRFFVATGTAAVLVGCSSGGDSSEAPDAHDPAPTTTSASAPPTEDAAKQAYLGSVNALCDALLPKVVKATDGGSTDVPAKEWVTSWPAHKALLDGFDADLAAVGVPPSAAATAQVIADYVVWATGIDQARITAAQQGEEAWQAELRAETDLESAPELLALGPAGFSDSCQAR